jgi:predicted kinase
MTKVYLIHGFIGAGKSTYARKLAQEMGAVLLSVDAWMAHFYGYDPNGEDFFDREQRVRDMQWQMAEILVQRGVSVIFDWGFWARTKRDEARARVQRMGGEPVLVALETPDDVALARVLKRTEAQETGSIFIDEAIFNGCKARFEPLQEDEVALRISG